MNLKYIYENTIELDFFSENKILIECKFHDEKLSMKQQELFDKLEDIQSIVSELKKRNIGILITDHNVQETLSITDRAYLLFEGSILKSGTAEELAADEQVRKVYLGLNFVLRVAKDL